MNRRWVVALGGLTAAVVLLTGCAAGGPAAGAGTGTSHGPTAHRTASPVHPPTTAPAPATGTSPSTGTARGPIAAVGALFPDGTDQQHSCTATVVASASGDVVMTAAHCVSGQASGMVFVPGYDSGASPFGTWTVTGAYAPAGWLSDQDEDDDVAFLTVAPHGTTTVEQAVGAVDLGTSPVDGETVSITAYNIGRDDQPVHCATKIRDVAEQPTIYCGGFLGGSSGSAWVVDRGGRPTAVGLIGGLHQGGCVDWTSYSPPFSTVETALLTQVGGGGTASQALPSPPDDGC